MDVRGYLKIDCEVKQNGFRKFFLSDMLSRLIPLKSNKKLRFWVEELSGADSQGPEHSLPIALTKPGK